MYGVTRGVRKQTKYLGDFQIESGKVFVSDPCYDLDTWCAKVVENVKNGTWLAKVETMQTWGERVSKLVCYHQSIGYPERLLFEKVEADIGVDSGQAGIFDLNHFKKDSDVDGLPRESKEIIRKEEPWYSYCCDRTLSKMAGVIPFGVVSSSGLGDGSYNLEVAKRGDEVVGMQVTFLEEEDYDDEEEEEEEEDEEEGEEDHGPRS